MKTTHWLTVATVAALAFGGVTAASADVTFTASNNPQANEENILLNKGETAPIGGTVSGYTNQSLFLVNFSSTTDALLNDANGQAVIQATDGEINNLTVTLPGGTFTDFIANAVGASGDLTFTVNANDGTYNFDYGTLNANGDAQNFFTILATGTTVINSITLDDAAGMSELTGVDQLKQPRMSGATGGTVVPEPGTYAAFAFGGLGLLGLMLRARRRLAVMPV